jgi:hypothetical protein
MSAELRGVGKVVKEEEREIGESKRFRCQVDSLLCLATVARQTGPRFELRIGRRLYTIKSYQD